MKLAIQDLDVRCAGRPERCTTTLATAGAYVVTVTSVLEDRSAALASCYLADLTAAQTAVSHMRLVPGGPAERLSQHVLGGMHSAGHARGCLLDHVAELRDLLAAIAGAESSVDVSEATLRRAAEAWGERDA